MKNKEELVVFSERLTQTREARGLSRKQLAEACGVNLRAFATYERNENKPQVAVLAKICEVLNVSADYLLGLTDQPDRPKLDPDLRPEQLTDAAAIADAAYLVARLDKVAPYTRNCLPVIREIIEELEELQGDTDNIYDDIREQHPAFELSDLIGSKARREIRVKAKLKDPEAIDFMEGEELFQLTLREKVNAAAIKIADMLIVDLFDQFNNKDGQ